jgi:SAM-dependent methyltransferase
MESFAVNRANWDDRAPAHAASPEYGLARFVADPSFLSDVVRFDRPRLGDLTGQRAVHLQCHIGTDTLSLARLGARMTGLDFSPAGLEVARKLAADAGTPITYVESDLYSAPSVLENGVFDLVYTGIGALCWLPDVRRWAGVVATLLRPGGRLFIREGHPMLWSIDESRTDALVVGYPYFETPEPMVFDEPGTYVTSDREFTANLTHEWNHGLGEIVSAVLGAGLELTALEEHNTVPWEGLPGRMTEDDGEWRLTEHPERLPLTYTLQAVKR